jgi:1-acyl-sn-glycerol-3-phosphate acyltransferase
MIPQIADTQKKARYALPRRVIAGLAWAARPTLRGDAGQQRSFARDARGAVSQMQPQPQILGAENIPPRGPCLVVCNHYSRDGLGVWWGGLALSAAIAEHRAPGADPEVRWVMTAAWTFPGWKRRFLTPLTRWAFARVARVYGFVPMPPMPPDPDEAAARAAAVLRTVRLARQIFPRGGMIGLAPEGRDVPGEFGAPRRCGHRSVGTLPSGAGAFVALLVNAHPVRGGLPVLPAGIGERPIGSDATELCVSFGPPFTPHIPAERARRDTEVAQQVVSAIKCCISEIGA